MKNLKKYLAALLCFAMLVSFASCASESAPTEQPATTTEDADTATEEDTAEPTEAIPVTIMATDGGNDSNTEFLKWAIAKYDEAYAGQYYMDVEWVPGVAEDLRAKLKTLNSANDLPAIVTDLGSEPALADLMMDNNRLVDLKPHFDASEEWQNVAIPESVEYNTIDGKMYTAPSTTASYAGMYYNKELFAQAGIEEFPKTMDEFWEVCDQLVAAGITPLSLHTTETGWCPMIFATSQFALTESGMEFANTMYPTDFDNEDMRTALDNIKKMFSYSTTDAVGGNYALAANNFASGNTAMIPNGPWMIPGLNDPQFAPEGFAEKVGYAAYPESVMIYTGGYSGYGLAVSVDVSEEEQLGAIEWIKFDSTPEIIREACIIKGEIAPFVPLTDEDYARMDPIMIEYSEAVSTLVGAVPNYQGKWDPITQNEVVPTELVNFINGSTSVDDLIAMMNAAAEEYVSENE